MNIHIANLSLNVIDSDLRKLFSPFGEVASAVVVRDLFNGRSKGTAFIDMFREGDGIQAIQALHRTMLDGKQISVTAIDYDPTNRKN